MWYEKLKTPFYRFLLKYIFAEVGSTTRHIMLTPTCLHVPICICIYSILAVRKWFYDILTCKKVTVLNICLRFMYITLRNSIADIFNHDILTCKKVMFYTIFGCGLFKAFESDCRYFQSNTRTHWTWGCRKLRLQFPDLFYICGISSNGRD